MSQRCVVVGAGGHARVVLSILRAATSTSKFVPVFVADLAPQAASEDIFGHPVLPLPTDLSSLRQEGIAAAFLAIGDNELRRNCFEKLKHAGFCLPNLISAAAYVDDTATLGEGNLIAPGAHVGPSVWLGDNNIVNTNADVEHECHVGNHCHLAPGSILSGRVRVGDGCLVGAGSVVIERLKIADRIVIGAGAVVVDDLLIVGARYLGVPAREGGRT